MSRIKNKDKVPIKETAPVTNTEDANIPPENTKDEEKLPEQIEVAPKEDPQITKSKYPLAIFCQLSGKKPDQMAGFRRYALTNKIGPLTIPEWKKQLEAFQKKPMR